MRLWRFLGVLAFALPGVLACGSNPNFSCVATCDGSPFSGYAGGIIRASSSQSAIDTCVAALQKAGCVSPKVAECTCVGE